MNPIRKFFYKNASALLSNSVRFADQNLWMPTSVSESIAYRARWREWNKTKIARAAKLWIHGASVGELEDLAAFFLSSDALFRAGLNAGEVMITSSSVSAQKRLRDWSEQKHFLYCGPIPLDTASECRDFLARYAPQNLLLSHNDFWPNLFFAWRESAAAKHFFWYLRPKNFTKQRLACFAELGPIRLERDVIGNLRLDRIKARIVEAKAKPHVLEEWNAAPQSTGKPSIIVGSCRLEDAQVIGSLHPSLLEKFQWVVIPHHTENIRELAQINQYLGERCQIIARQGILVEAYQGFDLAWVGGGFSDSGSHNTLEALAWGIPVISGPNTKPQIDTPVYQAAGALKTIADAGEISNFLNAQSWRSMKNSAVTLAKALDEQISGIEKLASLLKKAQ